MNDVRTIVVNGMKMRLSAATRTLGDLIREHPELAQDQVLHVRGAKADPLSERDPLPDDGELVSMPPVIKGSL